MRALLLASAFAGLCRTVYASQDFIDLEPVSRHLWDPNIMIEKRDDATHEANVTLTDHEQTLWSTGKGETSIAPWPLRAASSNSNL
jgi:hypothetical protein